MFIEFQFGNFRSFRDKQKFSMQAAPRRANDGGLEEINVFEKGGLRVLKTKAIYGGNASGKSNLAKAIRAFTLMVGQSVKREGLTMVIWDDRFKLLTGWDEEPMFFQYIFLLDNKIFRYGFQILNGAVILEWLFAQKGKKDIEYFIRGEEGMSIDKKAFAGAEIYVEQVLDKENEIFRPDALFLTGAALNGHKLAASIRNEIRNILSVDGVNDFAARQYAFDFLKEGPKNQVAAFKELMNAADTGIEDLEMLNAPESFVKKLQKDPNLKKSTKGDFQTLFVKHFVFNDKGEKTESIVVPFAQWESEGSGKLFAIGPFVLHTLFTGGILIIDEFDARFHPNLTLKIVNLFNSSKTNPYNAQLIFVTHDTGLLRRAKMRRDQIAFVDKDKYGISSLRTLIEYKGVRKDASYEKEYLSGSYSAVPFLDQMDRVIAKNIKKDGLSEAK